MQNNTKDESETSASAVNLETGKALNSFDADPDCDILFSYENNNQVIDPNVMCLASGGCCTCCKT